MTFHPLVLAIDPATRAATIPHTLASAEMQDKQKCRAMADWNTLLLDVNIMWIQWVLASTEAGLHS